MKAVILSLSVVGTDLLYLAAHLPLCGCSSQAESAERFVKESLKAAFYQFHATVGRYPSTEEGLAALLHAPAGTEQRWRGPYIEGGKIPLDPWGREYRYRLASAKSGVDYALWSLGPDGIPSADDIGNWTK
jgi:general secretion pathway protein G